MRVNRLLSIAVFLLLVSVLSVSAGIHADTISGTAMILGGQYFNFSSGQAGTQGDVWWINQSGIDVVMGAGMQMTTTTKGYFNTSPAYLEGMGPNMDINKTYKVPSSGDVNPFSGVYYTMFNFPLFQLSDGVAVKTNNNTYAVFSVTSINISGDVAVSINITYRYNSNGSNIFADKPTGGCAQHTTEGSCYESAKTGASCYWDNWMGLCNEAGGSSGGGGSGGGSGGGGGGGSSGGNFVDCIKFDKNMFACRNVSVCEYTANPFGGICDPTQNFNYQVGLNCSTFTSLTLCNNQPHTSPLCTWNGSIASPLNSDRCLENNTKANSNLPIPPYSTCDSAPSLLTCTNLTNLSYMPCEWDSSKSKCKMNFDGIFGGGGGAFGNIFDVTTKSSCEAMGGTWKTDTYSFTNSYGQTQTSTESWCEMSFGDYSKEDCADSCWACERQDDGSAWPTVDAAKVACINSSVGYCEFYQDSNALNGQGWCEPSSKVSFGYVDCSTICSGCFTNSSCAKSAATCAWTADPFSVDLDGNGSFDNSTDGFCDPQSVAAWKNCDQNCFACNTQTSCDASAANHTIPGVTAGCAWNAQQYYCSNATTNLLEICFIPGDENGNGLFDCADPACGNDPACGAGSGSGSGLGAGMGSIDSQLCIQHDNNQNNCQNQLGPAGPLGATPVCYYHPAPGQDTLFPAVGWCDSVFEKESSGGMNMDKPPVMLGQDAAADVSYPWLDIVGFGIHDSPQTIDIGIAIQNMTNNTACYKSFNSQPGRMNATGKYFRYIDIDSNTTNSCKADNDISITGFEYKFIHQYSNGSYHYADSNYSSKYDSTLAFKCVGGNWVPFSAQLTFMQDGCNFGAGGGGGPGGPSGGGDSMGGVDILLIKKADIGSPKVPMRIYVATHNGTNVSVDSAGPSYYTPGSVDAKFEDCSATGQDFDGDGLDAQKDPDCQKFIKLGYIPFEGGPQCKDGKDNDGNSLIDCADFSCKYDPYSGCGFALACDPNDKSAPQIKWLSVDNLLESAHVSFDSNEPANGTLTFYRNDSECSTVNVTIKDPGLLDGFTDNDFKPWHDADIGQNNIGYALAFNTTYYYKFKMSDLCGNSVVSNCNNFTTSTSDKTFIFKPVLDENITMSIPNLSIINNTFAYGKKLNQSQTKNLEIRLNDTFNNYGLTFLNCSITKAFDINLSGALVYNSTTNSAGMDTDKWNAISQELGCKTIKVKLPATGNELWHCDDNNQSNCYQVDNSSQTAEDAVTCTYIASSTECKIAVSQGLGFSVYQPRTTATSSSSSSSSSGGGSSGGGGSGGGVAVVSDFSAKATRAWDAIEANDLKVFAVKNGKISVSTLSFSVSKKVETAEVEIGVLKKLPSSVKDGGLTAYQTLQVTHKSIDNADVNSATFEFSVAFEWLANKSVEASEIALYRYDESKEIWNALSTELLSSDAEKAYYSASSPGLSYFAVAAKEKIAAPVKEEAPVDVQEEAAASEPSARPEDAAALPAPEKKGLPSWWIYVALTAVVVMAALIMERKKLSRK